MPQGPNQGLLAGEAGASSAIAIAAGGPLGIGVAGLNLALGQLGFDPLSLILGAFAGRPHAQATQDVARLAHSNNPVLQIIGSAANRVLAAGTVLSSPSAAPEFGAAFTNARTLLAQYLYGAQTKGALARAATLLQQAIHEAANPGSGTYALNLIRQAYNQYTVPAIQALPSPYPFNVGPQASGRGGLTPLSTASVTFQPPTSSAPRPGPPNTFFNQLGSTAGNLAREILQSAIPGSREFETLTGINPFQPAPVNPFQPPAQYRQETLQRLARPPAGSQPVQIAPLLDTSKPCPECDGLRGQQGQLRQEIQLEQQQESTQLQQQHQQEIEHFHQLEQQPVSQRDIPRELQQKQQLLQEIQNEINSLQSGQPIQQPVEGAPAPLLNPEQPTGQPPLEIQPGPQQGTQPQQGQPEQGQPTPHVQFCVGCASQEDAILFLNGEPSQCSVIPGSTQTMGA